MFHKKRKKISVAEKSVKVVEDIVLLREIIKKHNVALTKMVKATGVSDPAGFAKFYEEGYLGLYGLTLGEIKAHKGIPSKAGFLDSIGTQELMINYFKITQMEGLLHLNRKISKAKLFKLHKKVGACIRDAVKEMGAIAPEDLPSVNTATSMFKIPTKLKLVKLPSSDSVKKLTNKKITGIKKVAKKVVIQKKPVAKRMATKVVVEKTNSTKKPRLKVKAA